MERKVKATTINGYLSGLSQLHIVKGMSCPEIRTDTVKNILKGQTNIDNIQDRLGNQLKRLPMTMNMMRLVKEKNKGMGSEH